MSRLHRCRWHVFGVKKRRHPHNFVRLALFVPKKTPISCRIPKIDFFLCSQTVFLEKVATARQSQRFFFAKTTSPKVILDKNKNVQTKKLGVLFSQKKCSLLKILYRPIQQTRLRNILYDFRAVLFPGRTAVHLP